MKLLHPYAPYITEDIWSCFDKDELLIKSQWPKFNKQYLNNDLEKNVQFLMQIISSVRNIKIDLGISPKKKINIYSRGEKSKCNILVDNKLHLLQLVNIANIKTGENVHPLLWIWTCTL